MDKMGEATFDIGKRLRASGNGKVHEAKSKAKRGGKDRHSKVCTAAGGTRDRRVRLSPKTAILFYDLQDRLGCDRPSKAIDWLMTEAKAAIDALTDPPTAESNGCNVIQEHCTHLLTAPTPVELFDANSETVSLQRIFSCNYGASAPIHYPSPAREPLQSSYPQFQAFGFSHQEELPNFKEDEMLAFTNSSSTASFLHY